MISYLMARVMFALFVTIYEIYIYMPMKYNTKYLTLKIKVNIKKDNKSNLTASAVKVEANLQEQISDHLHIRKLECL